MPILPTGNKKRGVTLMEMMVVLAIISLIVGISVPSTLAGLENIRLAAGARSVAAFMNIAANRAERRQQAIELSVRCQGEQYGHAIPRCGFREEGWICREASRCRRSGRLRRSLTMSRANS